jgi:DNA-binding XRE family transcriptional regulator
MTAPTDPQIIMDKGKPAFAVIPWAEYQSLVDRYNIENETWIPHEVVKATLLGDVSIIRAWREYLNLTQEELAERAGLSQPALARIERPDTNPRRSTLKKLAEAMNLNIEQLSD